VVKDEKIINKNNVVVESGQPGRVGGGSLPPERARNERISVQPGDVEVGGWGGVKVAESISPAIIGSAGVRKTPLINTSSRALDNLRPRAADRSRPRACICCLFGVIVSALYFSQSPVITR